MAFGDIAVLLIAAFGAGVLNTIAGGGTFLTFPALVFTGMPPVAANATSAVAVFPGYLAGAFGFRAELGGFDRRQLLRLCVITLAGGLAGSGLPLTSSADDFPILVPFPLPGAKRVVRLGPPIRRLPPPPSPFPLPPPPSPSPPPPAGDAPRHVR